MTTPSRKRKALHTDEDVSAAQAALRKHFESRFAPLPELAPAGARDGHDGEGSGDGRYDDRSSDEEEGEDDDSNGEGGEDDEWGGISDDEDAPEAVEVVDYTSKPADQPSTMTKRELKAFMSSRPPTSTIAPAPRKKPTEQEKSLPEDSRALLAQDLALHRLITESHILDPNHKLHTKSFAEGRVRQRANDMRITALAPHHAESVLEQKSMPMHMRKGIEVTKRRKEEDRRREARENGIILERKGGKAGARGRKRGGGTRVDMPGVGTMRGAELRLSERDIRSIEGSGGGRGGRGGRGKGGRGGGRR